MVAMKQSFNHILIGCFIVCLQTISGSGAKNGIESATSKHNVHHDKSELFSGKRIKPDSKEVDSDSKEVDSDSKKVDFFDEENDEIFSIYLGVKLMEIGFIKEPCRCHPKGGPYNVSSHFDFNYACKKTGFSFLTKAVVCSNQDVIGLLLLRGVDINKPDGRGVTPLEEAISRKDEGMRIFLQKHGARLVENLTE